MTFSEKLIELRKNAGETQDALGEALGMSGKTISKWESAATEPDLSMLTALADHAADEGIDLYSLSGAGEIPVFDKYDDFVPAELLRRAYAADKLRNDELLEEIPRMLEDYERA